MSVSTAVPLALLIDKCASSSNSSLEPHVQCDSLTTITTPTATTTTLEVISSSNISNSSTVDCKVFDTSDEDEQQQVSVGTDPLKEEEENEDVATADDEQVMVLVRDFGYPESSPLHHGKHPQQRWSQVSLSSAEFTGRQARALYDFVPETEYEIGMNEGDVVWVQYRQCPGWLIADVNYETGLIPESYVEFI